MGGGEPFVGHTYLRVSAFIPMDARPSNITIKECGTVLERGNVAARGERERERVVHAKDSVELFFVKYILNIEKHTFSQCYNQF